MVRKFFSSSISESHSYVHFVGNYRDCYAKSTIQPALQDDPALQSSSFPAANRPSSWSLLVATIVHTMMLELSLVLLYIVDL